MAGIDLTDLDEVDLHGLVIGNPPLLPAAGHVEPQAQQVDQLGSACARGDLTAVKSIVGPRWLKRVSSSGAGAGICGYALHEAVANDHAAVVSYFLSCGVRPQMHDVQRAVENKSYRILSLFLDHGWDINGPIDEYTPPPLAIAFDDLSLTKWLLSHGANPNAPGHFAMTPLSAAVSSAPLEIILLLFENGGSVEHGQLLHYAVRHRGPDCLEIVQFLLEKGAAVNRIMFQDHRQSFLFWEHLGLGTPLHEAARLGKVDVAKLLLAHGADPLVRDSTGRLALDNALYGNHVMVAQLLRAATASSTDIMKRL